MFKHYATPINSGIAMISCLQIHFAKDADREITVRTMNEELLCKKKSLTTSEQQQPVAMQPKQQCKPLSNERMNTSKRRQREAGRQMEAG